MGGHLTDQGDGLAHLLLAIVGLLLGEQGILTGLLGVVFDVVDGGGHFVDGGRQHVGTLLRPLHAAQGAAGMVHQQRHLVVGLVRDLLHRADQAVDIVEEAVEDGGEVGEFILPAAAQPEREVVAVVGQLDQLGH